MEKSFKEMIAQAGMGALGFKKLEVLQVNLGNLCNLSCAHCHQNAGPGGKSNMTRENIDKILGVLKSHPGLTLDLTGGAPEMNPHFKDLVEKAREITSRIIVRTNLTVALLPGYEWLPGWYAENKIELVASMPCYLKENVDAQRGEGTYDDSIKVIRMLNEKGYGTELELDLVYNPGGPGLPGSQAALQEAYKKILLKEHGIVFSRLFAFANLPLGRFKTDLQRSGEFENYMKLLRDSFNPEAAKKVMCRSMISVDWQGRLYDCDFNQVVGTPLHNGHVYTLDDIDVVIKEGRPVTCDEHCLGCTAGAGSSCRGALS